MIENSYLDFNEPVNDKYRLFFEKFIEIDTLPIKDWKVNHVLAYFCKKYFDHYNTAYQFKYNNPSPSKCFEVFQIKRLSQNLSKDPQILKNYIDFIFTTKVKQAKRKLTSISFLTHDDVVNPYKIKYLFSNKIDRSTDLPSHIKEIMISSGFAGINTYGDLAFMKSAYSSAKDGVGAKFNDVLNSLTGFDINVLDSIV